MYFDSHAHLQLINYTRIGLDMDGVVQAALENGVEKFLCVATDTSQYETLLEIKKKYPQASLSIGLHPNDTDHQTPSVESLVQMAKHPDMVAIGETGLDYFRTDSGSAWQKKRFVNHILAAKEVKKPLIIHTRDSMKDTLDILESERAQTVGGIMHCFSGEYADAKKAIELNFLISFSGIVTFKNAKSLQEVAKKLPLTSLLIETDCPYLAPVPVRGQENQPQFVRYIGEFLANLKGVGIETFQAITLENAKRYDLLA